MYYAPQSPEILNCVYTMDANAILSVKVKLVLPSAYKSLCWVATVLEGLFTESTPHQQHWADSVQKSPINHLIVIGRRFPNLVL